MVRKEWQNLNGLWDLKLADGKQSKILVPYPVESALSGVMKHADHMTYRRNFAIPQQWNGRNVLLHFGAVDWEAKVSVNGKELGVHRGGYDDFSFDITAVLKASGEQEVEVEVVDPTDTGSQPRGKQVLHPGGIMYTPTSGIWQTVWLEPVAKAHVESLLLVPDVDAGCLRVTVGGTGTVEAVATDDGKPVAQVSGDAGAELKLDIPAAKLWSPDSPHLYDLRVSLKAGGQTVDEVASYFGMRKIALGKDEKGVTRLMLNGKFVFQVGPLDQGFWPDGIYTAATDEETECNGLLTYDRAVHKVIPERAAAVDSGHLPLLPVIQELVPTSQLKGIRWRFTLQKPAAEWVKPDFDDSAWKDGPGGFGTVGTPGAVVRTEWKTDDIWLRREFDWTSPKTAQPELLVHHDEDVEIYINGVLAGKAGGFISDCEEMAMTPAGAAALKPGKNVMAVHCHQTTGGQYIDVGIISVTPGSKK